MKVVKDKYKLEAIKSLLIEVCEHYGSIILCKEGYCDADPNGWEGCLTRKVLEIIDHE